jgi:RNA polymerase sigma-70 factor (ECF subfamily)
MSPVVELADRIASHRPELRAYCHRMLGSPFEADDAVQETLLRAWRGSARFEGRAPLRAWLYQIATNVCVDAANSRSRRPTPTDDWCERDAECAPPDPAEVALAREDLRLALIAVIRTLPPRQRAVLLLRDVLCWRAAEAAELLGTTVTAVNSSLQRARATLATLAFADPDCGYVIGDGRHEPLVARYLDAFDADDPERLTSLILAGLSEDGLSEDGLSEDGGGRRPVDQYSAIRARRSRQRPSNSSVRARVAQCIGCSLPPWQEWPIANAYSQDAM